MMRRVLLLMAVVWVAVWVGCRASEPKGPPAAHSAARVTQEQIDPLTLRFDLNALCGRFYSEAIGLCTQIASRADDPTIREETLRRKLRVSQLVELIAEEPDPRVAYLRFWLLIEEGLYYHSDGDGRGIYGAFQPLVIDQLRSIRERTIEIGYRHFPAEVIDAAKDDMADIAKRQSMFQAQFTGLRQDALTHMTRSLSADLNGVLAIPMAPITAMQGVGQSPDAVRDVARSVAEIEKMARNLPERTRWQLELLLYEAESLKTVKDLQTNLDRITDATKQTAETIDRLPEELRSTLEQIERQQPELRKTIDDARRTIEQTKAAAVELQKLSGSIEQLAGATDAAIGNARLLVGDVNTLIGRPEQAAAELAGPPGEPVTVTQIIELVDRLNATAVELRGLVNDLNDPLGKIDLASQRSLDQATANAGRLINAAAWRLAGIVVLAFVLAVVYRLVFAQRAPRVDR